MRTVELEEFRSSLRQPIEALLTEVQDLEVKLESAAARSSSQSSDVGTIVDINREIIAVGAKLGKRLDDADRSKFSTSNDWSDYYYSKEDAILQAMNIATSAPVETDWEKRSCALLETSRHLVAMRRGIRNVLEDQVSKISG
ncbi:MULTISPECIES: hypothetical protein [Phaeobacter]|uniref:hypothetical protein n=1 Tax=Phaeobacter TaxID=302485 RepID=UPI001039B74F|nr:MULTISPECIES: hypothetical protein [Phaeobacter]